MEHAEIILARHVAERLKALGTNAFAIERQAGLPEDAVRSILRGGKKSGTSLKRAQDVCEALGLEFYIGPPREAGPVEVIDREKEYAHVPVYDVRLAAGPGIENHSEEVVDFLAFRRSWLTDVCKDISMALVARASGDSMQPCISDGDLLLIDRSKTTPPPPSRNERDRRPPIFALVHNGEAKVKRVQLVDAERAILLSDNPEHRPVFANPDTLSIIGKVVWWGHTIRD